MLRAYVRLAVFAVGLLAGVQVPGFIDQYAKRVSAHYAEVSRDFAGFQRTADQYFGGSVEALLAHHAASKDAVFKDEAKTIAAMYARLTLLGAELRALQTGLLGRIAHVALRPNREMLHETIAAYSYTVPLDGDAIACGVSAGLLAAILVEGLLLGVVRAAGSVLSGRALSRAPAGPSHAQRRH